MLTRDVVRRDGLIWFLLFLCAFTTFKVFPNIDLIVAQYTIDHRLMVFKLIKVWSSVFAVAVGAGLSLYVMFDGLRRFWRLYCVKYDMRCDHRRVRHLFIVNLMKMLRGDAKFQLMRVLRGHIAIAFILLFVEYILIHNIMKSVFHRPRPCDVFNLGMSFSEVWCFAGDCINNCSFVSSHAGMGFCVCSLLLILPRRFHVVCRVCGIICGIMIGVLRMITGMHFMSDIFFAGLLIYGFILIFAAFFAYND